MALDPGSRLGSYEIAALIGKGGMGEVYLATDTNLKRQVAVKVLPDELATDVERLARFQREAEVLASLNHPNIAIIYGLERSDGTSALVMELVEGPTLADRISQGPIPVDEALAIARQIAEALEAAHEQGIIHRDLKPANVKLRADGTVKVLDFGLAKALEPTEPLSPGLSQSPTITTPTMPFGLGSRHPEQGRGVTRAGSILGTAAYMSPEQARGMRVDTRTDIWAFGCLLYEMLTGQPAFEAEDVSLTISKVLQSAPDLGALPRQLSPVVVGFIAGCLTKDLRHRVRHVTDVRLALEGAFSHGVAHAGATAAGARVPPRAMIRRLSVAALVGATAAAAIAWAVMMPDRARSVRRVMVTPSTSTPLSIDGTERDIAITPDGARIVYTGNNGTQLFVRWFEQLESTELLTALGTLRGVFTSPDGDWVGYVEGTNTLRKVLLTGGAPITLLRLDGNSLGASWGADNNIVLATANPATGLQRVSAEGGVAETLTTPRKEAGEVDHVWPEVLPDGRGVLFTITALTGGLNNAQIAVLDTSTGTIRVVLQGGHHARYVAGGYLVYSLGDTLRAIAFDLNRMMTHGPSVQLVPRLVTTAAGAADFAVADDTLVYVYAATDAAARTPVLVDRQGQETELGGIPQAYQYPRLTPDGRGLVLNVTGTQGGVWLLDLRDGGMRRHTASDAIPVWSPAGTFEVFSSSYDGGGVNLYRQRTDGRGVPERLTESPNTQVATSMTVDGRGVIYHEIAPSGNRDIRLLALADAKRPSSERSLVATEFDERNGVLSPDGRWLAYETDAPGRLSVFVKPFPEVDEGQWLVTSDGGRQPTWVGRGEELFYVSLDGSLMAVKNESTGPTWRASVPRRVLDNRYYSGGGIPRQYDVTADGQGIVVLKQDEAARAALQVVAVFNWKAELERLLAE